VGTTSSDDSTDGFKVKSSGQKLTVTRNGAEPLVLNRRASDGDIVKFRKDGSTVGSIGNSSTNLIVESTASNRTGLSFGGSITPRLGQASVDNQVDLGTSSSRFKDLYLSGGVFLGGTGAANKLDDYEEGTWTPSVSSGFTLDSTQAAVYRKVGDVVHVFGGITGDVSDGTEAILAGLPFSCGAGNEPVIITFNNGSTFEYIPRSRTNGSQPQLKFNPQVTANNIQILIQATYRTS
jgi:hypothetical protein